MNYFRKTIIIIPLILLCTVTNVSASIDLTTFNTKLSTFKNEKYAHNSTYQDNPSLTGGYICFGFANEVALYIWGSYPTKSMSASSVNSGWTVTYGGSAVDNLCVGDIVRYHYHSIFITGISGDTIYYCQANTPSGTNKVTYDNTVSRSNLKNKVFDQLTSPGTTKTGWVAHYTDGLTDSIAPAEPPSTPSVTIIKTNGTQVTVSWNAVSNATNYVCEIRKSEEGFPLACNSITTNETSCIVDLNEGGTYYACIYAYNGNASSGANWHIFGTPGRPEINNITTNGQLVTISWNATAYTARYECKILKAEDGLPWACNPVETTETNCTVMLPEGGTYYALITAINSDGCSGADWYIFGTPGTPSVDSIHSAGNQVTVNWHATAYTTHYTCTILKAKDGFPNACTPVKTTQTSCTVTLPEGETYYAVIHSHNANGNSGSAWTIFGTPGKPAINNISTIGNQLSINWDATANTGYYSCNIMKAEDGFPLVCDPIETSDTSCTFALPEDGTYYSVVYAYNSIGGSGSDWTIFSVKNSPYIISKVVKISSTHTITSTAYNIPTNSRIIIAGYKGNKMVDVDIVPYSGEEITTLTGDIDSVKVMVWDDLNSMTPLCDAEVIPSSEFIVE